jgi:hypothetical protein
VRRQKNVWISAGRWHLVQNAAAVAVSLADWFFSMLCRMTDSEGADLAMILWCLWSRRNDKVWDGDMKPINVAIQLARDTLFQWKAARNLNIVQVQQQHINTVLNSVQGQQQQINIMQW